MARVLEKLENSLSYIAVTKAMDAAALRQKTIAQNLANAETPHYKRLEVNFEDTFRQALEKSPARLVGFATDKQHIPINPPTEIRGVRPSIWRENDTYSRADDNNVELDVEMAELAKTQLTYDALTEVISRKFKGLGSVMKVV